MLGFGVGIISFVIMLFVALLCRLEPNGLFLKSLKHEAKYELVSVYQRTYENDFLLELKKEGDYNIRIYSIGTHELVSTSEKRQVLTLDEIPKKFRVIKEQNVYVLLRIAQEDSEEVDIK